MLSLLSSMATRPVLAAWAPLLQAQAGLALKVESVGGVDAARRVAEGEVLDLVLLASDALHKLAAARHVVASSVTPLMRSDTAVAVAEGAAAPDISTLPGLVATLREAPSIGYSTGPSGTALMTLLQQWGLAEALQSRLVQARPGVPVGQLVARGEAALGFQQLSELQGLPGVKLLGLMPPGAEISTVFAAAVASTSTLPDAAAKVLRWMASPAAAAAARAQGMQAMNQEGQAA